MSANITLFEAQLLKEEILSFLKYKHRMQQAIHNESEQKYVSFLHNKQLSILTEVPRHFDVSNQWMLDQIKFNEERNVLANGDQIKFTV